MKITMYDVNFGECILLEQENSNLLIDCGAKFNGTGALAFSKVSTKLDYEKSQLVITHFDEDH